MKKSRKDQKGRESVKKSGSEASDEDSENGINIRDGINLHF